MKKARSSDRTGILIVRLWIEGDARDGLRARITQTLDSTGHEQAVATAASPQDICDVVRTWVDAFVDADGGPDRMTGQALPVTMT